MKNIFSFTFFFFLISTQYLLAEVKFQHARSVSGNFVTKVLISGEIGDQTAVQLEKVLRLGGYPVSVTITDSPGGSVTAGLRMARLINAVQAQVDVKGRCYSSCAFLVFGSGSRLVLGEIGLHRPYLDIADGEEAPAFSTAEEVYSQVEKFMMDMGAGQFFTEMMQTHPTEMTVIGGTEFLKRFGYISPIKSEFGTWEEAQEMGLSTTEYLNRMASKHAFLDQKCSGTESMSVLCDEFEAEAHFFWDMTDAEYSARKAKAKKICATTQEQQDMLDLDQVFAVNEALDLLSFDPIARFRSSGLKKDMSSCVARFIRYGTTE